MATKKTTKPKPPESYEAGLQELETLVSKIESGDMPLDDLLTAYERGADLLNFCRDKLTALEQQIQVLEDGKLKPWNDEA